MPNEIVTSDAPVLRDFYNDMNEHSIARYGRVRDDGSVYVLELERHAPRPNHDVPGKFTLTVWRAVESTDTGEAWVRSEAADNTYEWDAKGRGTYRDDEDGPDAAQAAFRRLKSSGKQAIDEWCDEHPYDGPRASYHERVD
jgi:hypothetical protein